VFIQSLPRIKTTSIIQTSILLALYNIYIIHYIHNTSRKPKN